VLVSSSAPCTINLSGANTYTGATTIHPDVVLSASTLTDGGSASSIGASSNAIGGLLFYGGTLQYTGPETGTDRLFTVTTAGAHILSSGSGRMYIDVTTYAASALSGGLEFRIANGNTASTYNNIQIGTDASTCEGIAHIDSVAGGFDLIMAPFDLWSDADLVTSDTRYTGIKSSSWSLKAGKRLQRGDR
jgi:hypothetical protein